MTELKPRAWLYERGHAGHVHKTRLRDSGLHYYGEGFTETPLYTRPAPTDADVQRVADTELLHRVAEAMKERAAITATCNGCGTRSFEQIIADEIRAIDTAALVKEVCGHD